MIRLKKAHKMFTGVPEISVSLNKCLPLLFSILFLQRNFEKYIIESSQPHLKKIRLSLT